MGLADISTAFVLGLLTPLTAVCVLPLYPGFLAFLSSKFSGEEKKSLFVLFGLLVTLGVIVSMSLLGLLFTTVLQSSLTKVIGVISPIAFGLLIVISLLLIFDVDIGKFIPRMRTPTSQNPLLRAFLFGLFFGFIVIPCNPLFIAALFTRTLTVASFVTNMLSFVSFGVGMAFPLLVFSIISASASSQIIGFLSKHKRIINLASGVIMLVISLYYLLFVFKIFGGLV
jgi:cytochrome c-type biogenesis protein